MSGDSPVLIVFAKAPVPGRVKTRLARRVGAGAAAGIYRALLAHTMRTAAGTGVPVELWCAPGRHPFLQRLARRHGARERVQPPGDLGRRMHAALSGALRAGRMPVVIGADCAGLGSERIGAAFAALRSGEDAVIAAAEDGGYVLIGLRRPAPDVFRAIPWGGPRVMTRTRRALARSGLRWRELEPAFDVDDYRDYRRWRRIGGRRHTQYP